MSAQQIIGILSDVDFAEDQQRIDVLIHLLEKRLPIQPVTYEDSTVHCPECDATVYDRRWEEQFIKQYHINFCYSCGQRFTNPADRHGVWEEEEEVDIADII